MAAKLLFLFYEYRESFELTAADWLRIFVHGFSLDLSTASYIMIFPALIIAAGVFLNNRILKKIIDIYTYILLAIILLLVIPDLELYKYWGVRLDISPLKYLKTPQEAMASTSYPVLFTLLAGFVILYTLSVKVYNKISSIITLFPAARIYQLPVFLLIAVSLVIPVRGGVGVSTMNVGSVYFHENQFANHAAVNVCWNFGNSFIYSKETVNRFSFYESARYRRLTGELYPATDTTAKLLNTNRPNIVIIMLESFSAKLIEVLGGEPGVTPAFNKLATEGVLFSNIYSTDSRTDKGMAAIISGYPVTESIPILSYPEKNAKLPFLSTDLAAEGYHTSFSYGGDIDFANMKSYLVNGKFATINSGDNYQSDKRKGKWGLHDEVMFNNFYNEIVSASEPYFKMMLTITNHEPFEFPGVPKFNSRDPGDKFRSTAFYADSCLGDFVSRLKRTPEWENLLLVLVADHGARLPDFSEAYDPLKFHIPLLWIGGAVKGDTVVEKYGNQADLTATLLKQLDLPTSHYTLSRDLLSPESGSFAFYSYVNGFGMVTDTSSFGLNFATGGFNFSEGLVDEHITERAKAIQQFIYQMYIDL